MRELYAKSFSELGSADVLLNYDRCARLAHWDTRWLAPNISASEALTLAVDAGVMSAEKDPGQFAGDTVMTIVAERTLNVEGSQYESALHLASMADLITTALRTGVAAFERPEARQWKTLIWESSAFIEAPMRLRRIAIVDRWSTERKAHELHSWRTLGEQAIYELPMTITVIVIGHRKLGRYPNVWTRGWLHPRSKTLRIQKRRGDTFRGGWTECWREHHDEIDREDWLDQMYRDGAMHDVMFPVEVPLPDDSLLVPIRALAENNMRQIVGSSNTPPPSISACDWPRKCKFHDCCWKLKDPSQHGGYIPISSLISTT